MSVKYRGAIYGVIRVQFNGALLMNAFCVLEIWPNGRAEYTTFLETLGRVLERFIALLGFYIV